MRKLEIRIVDKSQLPEKVKISRAGFFSPIIIGLVVAGIFCSSFYVFAQPFTPGAETNPTCLPTDPTCTVTAPIIPGSDASLNSLSLTTVLSTGNGGTGKSTWATAKGVLYASNASTLTQTGAGSLGEVLTAGADGTPAWAEPAVSTLDAVLSSGNTTIRDIVTSGALEATNGGSKWVKLTNDGTSAELNTDTPGDVYFFNNATTPNYNIKINGRNGSDSNAAEYVSLGFDATNNFLIDASSYTGTTSINTIIKLDDTAGNSSFRIHNSNNAPVAYIKANGDATFVGTVTMNKLNATNIDPAFVLFDPQTENKIRLAVSEGIPDAKKTGAVMFYNQEAGEMEIYMPFSNTFYSLGGTQISESGTVGNGAVSGLSGGAGFVEMLKTGLASLGVAVSNGANGLKNLIVDTITVKNVRMETMEMVDKTNGSVYCVWIENGEWKKTQGACSTSAVSVAEVGQGAAPILAANQTADQIATQAAEQAATQAAQQAAQQAATQASQQTAQQIQAQAEQEAIAIASVPAINDISVVYGTSISNVLPANADVTLADNSVRNLGITWDEGTPVFDGTIGTYVFSGNFNLQAGIDNAKNLKVSVKVTVTQAPPPAEENSTEQPQSAEPEASTVPQTSVEANPTVGGLIQSSVTAIILPIWNFAGSFFNSIFSNISSSKIFLQAKAEILSPINLIGQIFTKLFSR